MTRSRQHLAKRSAHTTLYLGFSFLLLIAACKGSETKLADSGATVAASDTTVTASIADHDWDWFIVPVDCNTEHKKCKKGPQLEIKPDRQVQNVKPDSIGPGKDSVLATITNTSKNGRYAVTLKGRDTTKTLTLNPGESATWLLRANGGFLVATDKTEISLPVHYYEYFDSPWPKAKAQFNRVEHARLASRQAPFLAHQTGPWVTCDLGCCTAGDNLTVEAKALQ